MISLEYLIALEPGPFSHLVCLSEIKHANMCQCHCLIKVEDIKLGVLCFVDAYAKYFCKVQNFPASL